MLQHLGEEIRWLACRFWWQSFCIADWWRNHVADIISLMLQMLRGKASSYAVYLKALSSCSSLSQRGSDTLQANGNLVGKLRWLERLFDQTLPASVNFANCSLPSSLLDSLMELSCYFEIPTRVWRKCEKSINIRAIPSASGIHEVILFASSCCK